MTAGASLDYTLLDGTGGACYTLVVCFFNEVVCVVHCSSVGVLRFCSARLPTTWIFRRMTHRFGLMWTVTTLCVCPMTLTDRT